MPKKVAYIISDINKAVFFEHTTLLMRAREVGISWILINSENLELANFLKKHLKIGYGILRKRRE